MMKYFLILCVCFTFVSNAQSNHPYASSQPIPEPKIFTISSIKNMWHISFTPDGNTIYFLDDYNQMESVFYSTFSNGEWSKPKLASFSGKYRIETPCLSPDGSKFYFTLPIFDTVNHIDNATFHVAEKTDTGWTEPQKMGPELNIASFQNCPRVVKNGSIYFTCLKSGEYHIYRSKLVNGKYTTAQKVGSIMDMHQTADFCIAQDESYIIFQEYDNFYISFNNEGKWTRAISLGSSVNSNLYETRPYISPDENYLFYKRLDPANNWLGEYYQIDIKPLVDSLKEKSVLCEGDANKINIAKGKAATSSSHENQFLNAAKAVDGSIGTRWASKQNNNNPQWLIINLGKNEKINSITIQWELYAEKYKIEISTDSINWQEIYSTENGTGGLEKINFAPTESRFVKITGTKSGTQYGYSISEVEIFKENATGVSPSENPPKQFLLNQNYPNPFNPSTTIQFSIPLVETHNGVSLPINLKIFDVLGREVATLVNESKTAGSYSVTFNAETLLGAPLPSGVYFYQFSAGNYIETKKMMLMK